ncbi:hypothetical protein DM02DRAFT_659208 [Periconia macrospinosa]|uniref:Uncharacterized protein n=1 Tax=Periconia macrospinosa TaxID=97972 RepID=A0A2V1DE60_9PLEO|nr:hypothetical protein DM02DRAFT_659208 [Periconia macrospinosa]
MHIHKFITVFTATIGFTQALVLPPSISDVEVRTSSPKDGPNSILTRAAAGPVCNKSKSKECTTCPKAMLTRAAVAKCDPKKQKCPSTAPKTKCTPQAGKTCKREELEHNKLAVDDIGTLLEDLDVDNESSIGLEKRVDTVVPMYGTVPVPWGPLDSVTTRQLSVCSVVAVWDQHRVVMAHIPPGEPQPDGDILDSAATIRLYLGRIDAKLQAAPLTNPKSGYFLASITLSVADKETVRNWAIARGISLQTRSYSFTKAPGATLRLRRPAVANAAVIDDFQNPGREP